MRPLGIVLALIFVGIICLAGCTSEDSSAGQNKHAIITIKQLDVIMLENESGGDCFIAGLYLIENVGNMPVTDAEVSVDLMDVEKGEKVAMTNISVVGLEPGQSGNYTVRFDHLECVEKYALVAPLQKDFYTK